MITDKEKELLDLIVEIILKQILSPKPTMIELFQMGLGIEARIKASKKILNRRE